MKKCIPKTESSQVKEDQLNWLPELASQIARSCDEHPERIERMHDAPTYPEPSEPKRGKMPKRGTYERQPRKKG